MERRKAIKTAALASLTLVAGATGMALNSSIVGAGGDDGVGDLSPVVTAEDPTTTGVLIGGTGSVPTPTSGGVTLPPTATSEGGARSTIAPGVAPLVTSTTTDPTTTSTASPVVSDDDHDDEDGGEHEDRGDEDDDDHEYEGADDDD